jgi:proliferating cell nuclear antigen PCNA
MFSASLSDVKLLKDSVDTISQLIDEGIFNIKSDGIEMVATDRAMVAVIDFKLSKAVFDNYDCDKETSIALNLLKFLTVLKRSGSGDKLFLKLDEENNKLEVNIEGISKRKFSVPLLEISTEDIPPISQLDFPASVEVNASIINQGISDADIIADSVIIELSPENFKMFAESDSSMTRLKV